MRNVSNEYLELMKIEENNIKHQYIIYNETKKLDLTDLLVDTSFTYSTFLRTAEGNISPNTLSLKLEVQSGAIRDILVKNFERRYKDFPRTRWKDILTSPNLENEIVKNGDIITVTDTFNNERLIIFKGEVRNIIRIDNNLGREITLNIEDSSIKGYENVFNENIVFENYYIANNNEKNKSLFHLLCSKFLGFDSKDLLIADIKLENDEYIKIPLIKFEKGTKIMTIISELVRSVYGNIYVTSDGKLKINSAFDKRYINITDVTLGDKMANYPILEFVESNDVITKTNKVEVTFTNTVADKKQAVFSLSGHNGTAEDSKIKIKANTESKEWWKIEFNDVVDLDLTPQVEAYIINGNTQETYNYTDYIIEDLSLNGGRIKFNNTSNKDIFIRSFKFLGRPLIKYKDNVVSYTESKFLNDNNTNIKSVDYKYIMSEKQALLMAKHTYYNECRNYSTLKLRTNNMPFLELEDVINVDFKRYVGKYQIISINQANDYMELVLKPFFVYEAESNNFITVKSNYANEDFLKNKANIIDEKEKYITGLYEYNKNSPKLINTFNHKRYDIKAYINEIPLNLSGAVKTVCEVVKSDNGFYIKVGVVNANNEVIGVGKATWIAKLID